MAWAPTARLTAVSLTLLLAFALIAAWLYSHNSYVQIRGEQYGHVVIVMSRGRSGSDFISRVTENIATAKPFVLSKGLFGQKPSEMVETVDPLRLIRSYLKQQRRRNPSNIIGFKWKPYVWNDQYERVLQWCGKRGFKILWNHRNQLDEYISHVRHTVHKNEMLAHCYDESCRNKERLLTIALNPNSTLAFIKERFEVDTFIREKLEEYAVDSLEILYEEITYGSDEERIAALKRINEFAVPPQYRREVGLDDFETGTYITSDYHQRHTIENYDEIAAILTQHGYANLLHP